MGKQRFYSKLIDDQKLRIVKRDGYEMFDGIFVTLGVM